jgi:hypothetical protein
MRLATGRVRSPTAPERIGPGPDSAQPPVIGPADWRTGRVRRSLECGLHQQPAEDADENQQHSVLHGRHAAPGIRHKLLIETEVVVGFAGDRSESEDHRFVPQKYGSREPSEAGAVEPLRRSGSLWLNSRLRRELASGKRQVLLKANIPDAHRDVPHNGYAGRGEAGCCCCSCNSLTNRLRSTCSDSNSSAACCRSADCAASSSCCACSMPCNVKVRRLPLIV